MHPFRGKGPFTAILTFIFAGSVFGSPLNSRLLSLVPPGAQIVAGFENHSGRASHGRLLLTTHNNRLDLEDFESLTGVDSKRVFNEIIEVAAAPAGGALSEHMLLAGGRFDRQVIFRSIEMNGAASFHYQGEPVLLIRPLTRERGDMLDPRWMVILENRICMFGTRGLVKQALRRYFEHAVPDSALEERLRLLRRDVSSWNVLVPSAKNQSNLQFAQPRSAWAQLQQDADVLMVAARFGSSIRVDFSIYTAADRGPEFFTRKAGLFTDALMDGTSQSPGSSPESKRRIQNLSVESNRVQGSMELSMKQYSAWCDHLFMERARVIPAATNGD
jgi:hypothetical protein